MNQLKYRHLKGYKYILMQDISIAVDLPDIEQNSANRSYAYISVRDGILTIRKGYAWDGASGPTWDDKTNMLASLVHDAIYQLMREGLLKSDKLHDYRRYADAVLVAICRANGMSRIRAWLWYQCIRIGGKKSSLKRNNPRGKVVNVNVNDNFKI